MPKIPDSTKNSLHLRLMQRARARWPQLAVLERLAAHPVSPGVSTDIIDRRLELAVADRAARTRQ